MSKQKVTIIGAGLAGLTAAFYLKKAGYDPLVVEADDQVGGRVRTDKKDGFLLDRGFQILLPAYPEARSILDYGKLELQYFQRGAEIYKDGKLIPFYDPADGMGGLVKTLMNGPAQVTDLFKLLGLKSSLTNKPIDKIYSPESKSTLLHLEGMGFSKQIIEMFWKPFFQGIFLEDDLHTSNHLFEFIFKMFIEDGAAIPREGMGKIPHQIASHLSPDRIKCKTKVKTIEGGDIIIEGGQRIEGDCVVVACPTHLLGLADGPMVPWKAVSNFYYAAKQITRPSKCVMLCANDNRTVNNVTHLSMISKAYATDNRQLISVSANGNHLENEEVILADLRSMYGSEVDEWELIESYLIKEALPDSQVIPSFNPIVAEGVYRCGDYLLEGSINGAMKSGRMAAEAIIAN